MDYKKFSDFIEKTADVLLPTTFIVGYEDDGVDKREIKLLSDQIRDDALSTFLYPITSLWSDSTTITHQNSSGWSSVYTSVHNTSADWNSVHTSVYNTSADWDYAADIIDGSELVWDATRTTVFNLSAAWPYRTGDTIVEMISIDLMTGGAPDASSSTTLNGNERASFLLDIGDTTKWKKSGCTNNGIPTITWFIVGRTPSVGATAEWDLYNRATGLLINGSTITTTTNTVWQVHSVTIPQANWPTTMSPVAIRSRVQTPGTVETYTSMIQLTWTVA